MATTEEGNNLKVRKTTFKNRNTAIKGKPIVHISDQETGIDVHLEFSIQGRNCMLIVGGQLVAEFDPRGER